MTPSVSIIVPTYNRAHLITKTIDSLLNQSNNSFEIIIVDDGSTDNTDEIVKPYLSDKLCYFKKENAERAAARNFGTKLAKGEYVNWFDSDDIALSNHIDEAVRMIKRYNKPELFALGFSIVGEEKKVDSHYKPIMNNEIYKGNFCACNPVFVRRDIALTNSFNEDRALSASEDYELWLRLSSQYTFYTSPIITSHLIQHDERSVLMSNPIQLINRFEKFLYYTLNNDEIIKLLGSNLSYFKMKNYLILSVDLAANNHKLLAINFLWKAMKSSPNFILDKSFYATCFYLLKKNIS